MKQQLQSDIRAYFQDKWQGIATDALSQIVDLRPDNAFGYLFQKTILKLKHDNNISSLLIDISLYCIYCDPVLITSKQFQSKLFTACFQKHNLSKLKKTDFKRLLEIVCLELQPNQKNQLIATMVNYQNGKVQISNVIQALYYVTLYCRAVNQVKVLVDSLEEYGESLSGPHLIAYLKAESNSYIHRFDVKLGNDRITMEALFDGFLDSIRKDILDGPSAIKP